MVFHIAGQTLSLGTHGWTFYETDTPPDPPIPPPLAYAWRTSSGQFLTSDGTKHDIRYDRLTIDGYHWADDKAWIRGVTSGTPHTARLFGGGDMVLHWIQAPGAAHRLIMFCAPGAHLPFETGGSEADQRWTQVAQLM